MHLSLRCDSLFPTSNLRQGVRGRQTLGSTDDGERRCRVLRTVDKHLSKGNFKTAISIVKKLKGKPGGLRCFGAAKQVFKKISPLEELDLTETEILSLQSLLDSIMDKIKSSILLELFKQVPSLELENSIHGENQTSPSEDYLMCLQHEAGHFLVGYLVGALPRSYIVGSMDDIKQGNFGGSVLFSFTDFLREVDLAKQSRNKLGEGKLSYRAIKLKVSSTGLNRFMCITIGGLVAEHLVFGHSMGLHYDVEMMSNVVKWLGYTEDEAYSLLRWAALNAVLILSRHSEARSSLAERPWLKDGKGSEAENSSHISDAYHCVCVTGSPSGLNLYHGGNYLVMLFDDEGDENLIIGIPRRVDISEDKQNLIQLPNIQTIADEGRHMLIVIRFQ